MNLFGDLFRWFPFGRSPASRIFVSYRREDSRGDAGRLTDNLKVRYGEKQIFRDVEAIAPGVDFVEAINTAVGASTVLLAIIGPNWLKVSDAGNRRRLDDPNDFVRLEIAAALNRNIRVIPVLVGGATMPKVEELPAGLASFARRQAHELSDTRWDFDVGQLLNALETLGIKAVRERDGERKQPWWKRNQIAVGAGSATLVILGYLYSEFEDDIAARFSSSSRQAPAIQETGVGRDLESSQSPNLTLRANESAKPAPDVTQGPPPIKQQPVESRPQQPAPRALSYSGFDAIGRYPTVVQVLNPG